MTRDAQQSLSALLARGDVEGAGHLLGSSFALRGTVIPGDRRGRTIGFPTANLAPQPGAVVPGVGVYAGVTLGRPAAISVGLHPTFGAGEQARVEVHLLDFSGDLYGSELTVTFLARLREEQRFADAEALVAQLRRDVGQVRELWERITTGQRRG